MPGPLDAGIDRREAVQRNQHGRNALTEAAVDHLSDAPVIGIEHLAPPRLHSLAGEAFIAGNDGGLADARYRTRCIQRAIAVDHEPRIGLRDQMRIKVHSQRARHAGNADVPGDMPRQFALGQTEIAELARDSPAEMIGSQQERRASLRVLLHDRCRIVFTEE